MLLKQKLVAFVQQHLDQVYLKIQHTLKILDRELTSNLLNFKEIQSQPMLKGHYTIQRLMVNQQQFQKLCRLGFRDVRLLKMLTLVLVKIQQVLLFTTRITIHKKLLLNKIISPVVKLHVNFLNQKIKEKILFHPRIFLVQVNIFLQNR